MQVKEKAFLFKLSTFFIFLSVYIISSNSLAQSNTLNVAIQGVEAKKLFAYLTGPKVHPDAGMSKQYLQGINVGCQYVTAPISHNGVNVPMSDPSRYSCSMNFDSNGLAESTPSP